MAAEDKWSPSTVKWLIGGAYIFTAASWGFLLDHADRPSHTRAQVVVENISDDLKDLKTTINALNRSVSKLSIEVLRLQIRTGHPSAVEGIR
jgi:hypothetical protein